MSSLFTADGKDSFFFYSTSKLIARQMAPVAPGYKDAFCIHDYDAANAERGQLTAFEFQILSWALSALGSHANLAVKKCGKGEITWGGINKCLIKYYLSLPCLGAGSCWWKRETNLRATFTARISTSWISHPSRWTIKENNNTRGFATSSIILCVYFFFLF